MAWYDFFRRRREAPSLPDVDSANIAAAKALDDHSDIVHAYDNRNITFSGELDSYDYDAILRDKQKNITRLFELADYFVDEDPIVRGIIRGVYSSFSMTDWRLVGDNEGVKKKYEMYYDRINLRDRMASIFYQYFKYGNVYLYLQEDGNIVTLPVHKTRISDIMINGEPVLEFNAQSVQTDMFTQGSPAAKHYIKDDELNVKLYGYPPEVEEGIRNGHQWVQLNPKNTFVLQDLKEDWMRYAVPIISACLTGLKKKAKISKYEDVLLDLGANSFVHVRYGNENEQKGVPLLPNKEELTAVNNLFRKGMQGGALVTTNHFAHAEVIQPTTSFLFDSDKYKYANAEILAAGGISGIIVSGRAEDGSTFASAQVSINTADKRIELARNNFCELMNKINLRVNGDQLPYSKVSNIPKFELLPIDLSGTSKFQKTCMDLWRLGCMSTETLLDYHGFNWEQELGRKKQEVENGEFQIMKENGFGYNYGDGYNTGDGTYRRRYRRRNYDYDDVSQEQTEVGRPEVSDEERTSDMSQSITGKQPKPSNPDGSMGDSIFE